MFKAVMVALFVSAGANIALASYLTRDRKSGQVALTAGQQNTVEGFYNVRLCPLIDADFGEAPGTCTGADFRSTDYRVILQWNTEENAIMATYRVTKDITATVVP